MPTFAHEQLAVWTGGRWTCPPGAALTGFSQDTRTLAPGQVFVALRTEKRDGHDFLAEAEGRGAVAALVAREVPGAGLPQLVVADPLAAFQRIAREHRLEFHGTVVGVTGSAGKTSTKDLLALLLGGDADEVGPHSNRSMTVVAGVGDPGPASPRPATVATASRVLKTEGNLNNCIGVPLTLTRLERAVHRAAVVEAGISLPDEMATLAEMIEPDHSVVTLVGPAHLEQLGTVAGVAAEKARLPAANRRGGLAVFPAACWQYEPFRVLANPLVLVPATGDMIRIPGRTLGFTVLHRPERTEVTLGGRRPFVLRRVSGGMAQNAALALALAAELGVADAQLRERLAGWVPSKWRGELQQVGTALVYSDFYNANPASMQDAITAFAGLVRPELPRLYVLGCMEELGSGAPEYHRQLGRSLVLRPCDFLYVLGGHADAVRAGLLENGNDPAQVAVITEVAPVRERLAGFTGAVFLKASRRYRLETILDPQCAATAH
ncbi:MAG: UDP-N-acetylmuramoyl-tripeptide--D-alanyl-D-alanine ligase [Opitutales bacterium]